MGTRKKPRFKNIRLIGTEGFRGKDTTTDIRLLPMSHSADPDNLMHLTFDYELPVLLKDESGNFKIIESSYIHSTDSRSGRGAALFNRPENKILIQSPEELWPGTKDLGDFSIEMWIKPMHFSWKNILFRKDGLESSFKYGMKKSIEIYIMNGRLHFLCRNLFTDTSGKIRSIHLVSRSRIKKRRWIHFLVSYRAVNGKLTMFINGREERLHYARNRQGIWHAGFSRLDRTPMAIGESFFGLIDEFRITKKTPTRASNITHTRYPPLRYNPAYLNNVQRSGYAISRVMKLKKSKISKRARIKYTAEEPGGSALNFYVRYSIRPFNSDTPDHKIPWKLLYHKSRNTATIRFIKSHFSYIQWKAELRADPSGKITPILKEIHFKYIPFRAPVSPLNVRVITGYSRDEKNCRPSKMVCLEWSVSPEADVRSKRGGYFVYYGVRPGEYLGRIGLRENTRGTLSPIKKVPFNRIPLTAEEIFKLHIRPRAFKKSIAGRLRILITNKLIEKNMIHSMRTGRGLRMPLLRNNRTYFFAVSAYYRTKEGVMLESKLSMEATAILRDETDS